MLPIVDYGSIAIVIPKIAAVGNIITENDMSGFEIFLSGIEDPIIIEIGSEEEAREEREELIAIIAQYYYISEFGPDFEFGDIPGSNDDDINEH